MNRILFLRLLFDSYTYEIPIESWIELFNVFRSTIVISSSIIDCHLQDFSKKSKADKAKSERDKKRNIEREKEREKKRERKK